VARGFVPRQLRHLLTQEQWPPDPRRENEVTLSCSRRYHFTMRWKGLIRICHTSSNKNERDPFDAKWSPEPRRALAVWNHLLIFGIALGTVSAVRIACGVHFARESQEVAAKASQKRSRQIEAAWRLRTYNALSAGTEEALIRRVPWTSLALSELQQTKLRVRLTEVLHYLELPTLDEYYRLKTEGFHWSLQPHGSASNLLVTAFPRLDIGTQPARAVIKVLWEEVRAQDASSAVFRLTAVCLDSVIGGTEHTNTGGRLLTGTVKQGFTVAVEAVDPGFVYVGGKVSNVPLLFQLSFLAKANGANGAENVGPVYVSLLWVEEDKNWGLNRLITDSWLKVRTIF
jgi:hypothetical protein